LEETLIRGRFDRESPAKFAEKVGIPLGWFVISYRHIPSKTERRIAHGRWYRISCSGISIYRILRFSPNLTFAKEGASELVIDWVGWLDLHNRAEEVDGPLDLEIEPVPTLFVPFMVVMHPDSTYRIMGWLGIISVILGMVSIIVAFK
jgi:hypothetical protein